MLSVVSLLPRFRAPPSPLLHIELELYIALKLVLVLELTTELAFAALAGMPAADLRADGIGGTAVVRREMPAGIVLLDRADILGSQLPGVTRAILPSWLRRVKHLPALCRGPFLPWATRGGGRGCLNLTCSARIARIVSVTGD